MLLPFLLAALVLAAAARLLLPRRSAWSDGWGEAGSESLRRVLRRRFGR